MDSESSKTRRDRYQRDQTTQDNESGYEDEQMPVTGGLDIQVALVRKDISYMKRQLSDIKYQVGDHYVTKDEFEPVRKLVYGMVALVLITVMGLLLSLVVHK
jgi:hypothetical protein